MKIRLASDKDIPRIIELLKQVSKVHYDIRPDLFMPGTTKYDQSALEEMINKKDYYIAVADIDSKVVGYVICLVQETNSHLLTPIKTLYIDDLCVDENTRGLKIGKSLYNHAVEHAKISDCYNVTLNVWEGNDAKAFYESLGMSIQKTGMEVIIKNLIKE